MQRSNLRHLFLAFSEILATLPRPARCQNACLSAKPVAQQVVYEQPVSINTDVLSNITFYPFFPIAVTVSNAPTSFDGITTFTWTSSMAPKPSSPQGVFGKLPSTSSPIDKEEPSRIERLAR